jgi:hypothetical protein
VSDRLGDWASERAPALLARAQAEAVAVLRDALVRAALGAPAEAPSAPEESGTSPAPGPRAEDGPGLLWAYGIVAAGAPPIENGPGVAGGAVRRVEAGGLAALVSPVPSREFAAEPLRENLNDLAWLERVARAHEDVLDGALAATTVVPLRLCTIYESVERVRGMLVADRSALHEALDKLAGRSEWGVKLLLDPERLVEQARRGSDELHEVESGLAARSPGGAYLERRRLDRELRRQADLLATELADATHARLSDCAVAAVVLPAQNRDLSGREGDMMLNAAYLVDNTDVGRLRQAVEDLGAVHADVGARLDLTGPWPPHNFLPRDGAAAQP